jgi:Tol biopolymer transport system component
MYDTRKKQFSMILPRLSAEHVAYSRDGSRMAYVAEPDGTLWVSRKDQSDRRQLSFAPMVAALPSWSPDGRQIALMGKEPGKSWRIYLVSSEPGTFPTPVTAGDVSEGDQTWSPDGKSIAFAGVSGNLDSANHPVQIMDLTTHRIASLPGSAGIVGTRWSPDGKYLIAVGAHSGVGPLMLYSFATKHWTRLLKTPIAYPAWSHDGRSVYYIDNGNSIHRVRLSDRKPELIGDLQQAGQLANGRFGPWFGLAPDDSILALRDSGIEEIYSLQMDWR